MKLGVTIYTYDKIEEACIQMELIRNLWEKHFDSIKIVHVYNGDKSLYPKKYLEDDLIYLDNPGHYRGAANMMDVGIQELLKYDDLDYLMINAADVWRIKPEKIVEILSNMKKEEKVIGTCPWAFPDQKEWRGVGLACDTCFIDAKWERQNKIFPLKHEEFYNKYIGFIRYMGKNNVLVEALLASNYITACSNVIQDSQLAFYANDKVYILTERMPTIISPTERNFNTPSLGLYTDHDLSIKQKILIENDIHAGPHSEAFIKKIIS